MFYENIYKTWHFVKSVGLIPALNYSWQRYRHPALSDYKKILHAYDYSRLIVRFCLDIIKKNLLVDLQLNEESIVFDVGGSIGIWSKQIEQQYDPNIFIFEPEPRSFGILNENFQSNLKVKIFPYGLSHQNMKASLIQYGIGSSIYAQSPSASKKTEKSEIELKDIKQVIDDLGIAHIDVIKINIEGGEYDLLKRMIETGSIRKCKTLRIQFHEWYPNSHELRTEIRKSLSRWHRLEWDYPFIWESWIRKA